jgi:hypothetical protein
MEPTHDEADNSGWRDHAKDGDFPHIARQRYFSDWEGLRTAFIFGTVEVEFALADFRSRRYQDLALGTADPEDMTALAPGCITIMLGTAPRAVLLELPPAAYAPPPSPRVRLPTARAVLDELEPTLPAVPRRHGIVEATVGAMLVLLRVDGLDKL